MDERIESDIISAVKTNLIINNTNQSWFCNGLFAINAFPF